MEKGRQLGRYTLHLFYPSILICAGKKTMEVLMYNNALTWLQESEKMCP